MNTRTVSSGTIWMTWVSLMVLLLLTWLASRFNLGLGNTVIATAISGAKMLMVILFFMQVRYSPRLIWIFAAAGFVWWMIFISLTMTDFLTRKSVIPYDRSPASAQGGHNVKPTGME